MKYIFETESYIQAITIQLIVSFDDLSIKITYGFSEDITNLLKQFIKVPAG